MTVNQIQPAFRLRSYDDALGLIPHLLGFHPEESLVVLVIDGNRLELTARLDLSDAAQPTMVEATLARIWSRFPAADAWFVAYTAHREYAWAVLGRCDALLPAGRDRHLLAVDGGSWQAGSADGPRGVHDPVSNRLAAEATVRGMVARRSRKELAALLDGPPATDTEALVEVARRVGSELAHEPISQWPTLMGSALRRCAATGALSDDEAVRLATLAADPNARDVALLTMSRRHAERQLELWRRVVNRTLPVHQGHPLALLGMAAWLAGEGALVSICLERAHELAPPTGLLGILEQVLEGVIPPTYWDELRPELIAAANNDVRRAVLRRVEAA